MGSRCDYFAETDSVTFGVEILQGKSKNGILRRLREVRGRYSEPVDRPIIIVVVSESIEIIEAAEQLWRTLKLNSFHLATGRIVDDGRFVPYPWRAFTRRQRPTSVLATTTRSKTLLSGPHAECVHVAQQRERICSWQHGPCGKESKEQIGGP